MAKRVVVPAIALVAVVMFSVLVRTQQAPPNRQPGAVYDVDFPGQKSGPAPRRSLSGVWEFAQGRNVAIQADGAKEMPSTGKPEHELPFTPEGRAAFMANKPTFGVTLVPSALTNDPMPGCDPQGFPRIVLHTSPTAQFIQTPPQVVILSQFNTKWRVIWPAVRVLPKAPAPPACALTGAPPAESRFWCYSVGRCVDDYTFGPPDTPMILTISIGVALGRGSEPISTEMLLKEADNALYKAKTAGHNRVFS